MAASKSPPPTPTPRLDSWPAKSADAKLAALLPLARRIARQIARRCPRRNADDIHAAAAIGAWDAVRSHGELAREDVAKYATVRIRGAILDELRRLDWSPRRHRAQRDDIQMVGIDQVDRAELASAIGRPPEQEDDAELAADAARLSEALGSLSARQRGILVDYYLTGDRLGAIATRLGVSQARVSQIRKRAVELLRERLGQRGT